MSILFFVISAIFLLGATIAAIAVLFGESVDETPLMLIFIASGIFAVAGALS